MDFIQSGNWDDFTVYLKKDLQDTQSALCRLDLPEHQTQQLRGRAAYIQKLLNLGNTPAGTMPALDN